MGNAATVQAMYEAFGRGDIPAILDRLADDISWDASDPPTSAQRAGIPWLLERHGVDEVQGFFEALGLVEIHSFEVPRVIEDGDDVVALVRFDATLRETGERFKVEEMHHWVFGPDGKAIAYRHYNDTGQLIELVGNAAKVRAMYDAFGRGDIPAITERLADDVVWDHWEGGTSAQRAGVPWLQERDGVDGVAAFFESLSGLEFNAFDVTDIIEGGPHVVAFVRVDATIRETGTRFVDEEVHDWVFGDDGRVASFRHYVDTGQQIEATAHARV
jgi:uncharacterized protein